MATDDRSLDAFLAGLDDTDKEFWYYHHPHLTESIFVTAASRKAARKIMVSSFRKNKGMRISIQLDEVERVADWSEERQREALAHMRNIVKDEKVRRLANFESMDVEQFDVD